MQGELNPEGWMKKHRFYQVRREKKHLGRRGRASTRGQGLYPGLCGWSRAGGKAGSHRTLQSGDRLRKAPLGPCRFAGLGWGPGRCVPEKLPGAAQAAGPCTTLGVALHWWCSDFQTENPSLRRSLTQTEQVETAELLASTERHLQAKGPSPPVAV